MSADLEQFRLRSLDLGQLTGVSIAAHAIADAFLLLHSGVGCKHKATTQLSTHDWARGVVSREAWTEVGDASLIAGSADRIAPYARAWKERMHPGVMLLVSVTFLDLTGDDFADEVRKLDEAFVAQSPPSRAILVKAPGYAGDLWTGYSAATLELVRRVDWSAPPDRPTQVSILGYFFDRYEGDHVGNLAQIGTLLKHLGLELGPVFLSGASWADLTAAPRARTTLLFPYAADRRKALERTTKRQLHGVDLPIGIRSTSAWLRRVGHAAGVDPARVEAVVGHQERATRERIGALVDRLRGQRVAVFADLPLLAGTLALLDEFGIEAVTVGIRGHSQGGRSDLAAAMERLGAPPLPDACAIHENPSIALVRESLRALLRAQRLDGVIGSATDMNALTSLPPEEFFGVQGVADPERRGPFRLEIGFPAREHHCAYAMPFLGYSGVLMWLQRLLSAPRTWDSGRRSYV